MASVASYGTVVQQLYVTYFGRPADPIGLGNFEQALANANAPTDLVSLQVAYNTNSAVKSLVDSFGTSTESTTLYGTNVEAFVNAVFENVLGRAPLAAGLTFWGNAIDTGVVTMGDAALSIAAAALANSTDATTIANKTLVAQNFTADIVAKTGSSLSYTGSIAAAQARLLLANVTGTTDVTTYQSNVQSTVQSIGNILALPGGSSSGTSLSNASNTITSVSLTNYDAANINSTVLNTLTLAGDGGGLTIENLGTPPETMLALNLNGFTDASGIADAGIKTLNVVTGGITASTLGAFVDSSLTTLNVSGTETLALNTVNASLTKIAVSGSAGFTGDVHGLGAALASFTTTSSGTITAALDAAHQTFVGSTGQDIITISSDALKTITGGSATNNELILNGDAATFIAAHTVANVTGFTTLGIEGSSSGVSEVYNLLTLTGFKSIDVISGGAVSSGLSSLETAVGGATTIAAETTLTANAQTAGTITSGQKTAIDAAYATAFQPGQVAAAQSAASSSVSNQISGENNGIFILEISLSSASAGDAEQSLTAAAVTSGFITSAQKTTIDNDYAAEVGVSVSTAENDAATDAQNAGSAQVSLLNTLQTNVGSATSDANEQSFTVSAVNAGTITSAEATTIDTAYANAFTAGERPYIGNAQSAAEAVVNGFASNGTSEAFINVTTGTSLSIDSSLAATGTVAAVEGAVTGVSVLYQVANATGSSDSLSLKLGNTSGAVTVAALMLEDANAVGLATLNVATAGTYANTITTLIDNGLATLNVSGAAGLTITTLNEQTTQVTTFTINNTTTGSADAVGITTFTDANLGSLTFTGSGVSGITTLAGVTGHIVTISNTGAGVAGVGSLVDVSLQSLILNGSVIFGSDTGALGFATAASAATGATTGVTVAAGTDNAHINLHLTGASVGNTDKITVGNGNDYITDSSTAGSVNVTAGTGSNYIDIHTGTGAGVYSVTLGTHVAGTASDFVYASEIGTFSGAAVANTTITGAVAGDVLGFASAATSAANVTTAQQTAITAAASLSAAVALAFGDAAANGALSFQYGGNTFVVEQSSTAGAAQVAGDSIVELVGLHTLTAGAVTGGHVVLAS